MWTAYLDIFVRAGIMGLLKLYNCILLFLSFTFPFLLWLIPHPPSEESLFLFPFYLCTVNSISFHYANQFNFSKNLERAIEGELVRKEDELEKDEKEIQQNAFGMKH